MGRRPVSQPRPVNEHFVNASVLKSGLAGLYVKSRICKQPVDLIIDTGSSVTILASSAFDDISPQDQPLVHEFPDKLFLADGSELPVRGLTEIPFHFGSSVIMHKTVIADIESEGLIGLDFIKSHNCEINYAKKSFSINGRPISFTEKSGHYMSCRITAAQTITIPPQSEHIIQGKSP